MNLLKKCGDQVQFISDEMKAGKISMEQGAVELQAVAVLAEQDAAVVAESDLEYAAKLRKFVDMIYSVIKKMYPERGLLQ